MKSPDLPKNEKSRLAALSALNILDTPPEDRFDRLTQMTKQILNVPVAVISLVDENRQWFKSCIGLDVSETPRDISFCGHAINGDDLFIIPDASQDERFADNPLVENDPKIRFYAGCPLKALDGSKLGTLCIIDQQPRQLSAEQQHTLKNFGAIVERELYAIHYATRDVLTNINNRDGFILLGQQQMRVAERQKTPMTAIFLELRTSFFDNDLNINMDNVIRLFSDNVTTTLRDADLFARLSDRRFVILLNNTGADQAPGFIERLKKTCQQAHSNGDKAAPFTAVNIEVNTFTHVTIESLVVEGEQLLNDKLKQRGLK
ncbi:diguanylate cyclase (GGDEF)-like protein [Zhongshania antarctica]|uniref:Diguanylate cyclase (GGDEF)-like protein n=1 Tax=Zhongshania antarctica TaxID=641702 RepID=A0A840R048_9GAMM|nr:GAF domain-containing protein [Zhongshania antarctica]MBB5185936.1 diguanylate cyclase (GGDEF)-like protein [Zhongshania antarctica]